MESEENAMNNKQTTAREREKNEEKEWESEEKCVFEWLLNKQTPSDTANTL